jgi:hypothetical protein
MPVPQSQKQPTNQQPTTKKYMKLEFSCGFAPHFQGQVYNEDNGETVAITYSDEGGANARLFASAPELVEALQLCFCALKSVTVHTQAEKDTIENAAKAAKAALIKATN